MKKLEPEAFENDMAYVDRDDVLERYSPEYVAEMEKLVESLKEGQKIDVKPPDDHSHHS